MRSPSNSQPPAPLGARPWGGAAPRGPKVLGSFSGQSCGGGSAAATARDSSQFRAAPALCATLGGVRLPRVEHSRCEARPARKIARAVPRVRTARCTDWHTAQEGLAFRARMWHRGTLSAARAGRGGGYAPQSHYGLCRQNPCAAGERARGASNGKRRDMEESVWLTRCCRSASGACSARHAWAPRTLPRVFIVAPGRAAVGRVAARRSAQKTVAVLPR